MEAGLDSLGAVELRNALSARLAMELPATLTLDFPTIEALTAHLVALHGGTMGYTHGEGIDASTVSRYGSRDLQASAKSILNKGSCYTLGLHLTELADMSVSRCMMTGNGQQLASLP